MWLSVPPVSAQGCAVTTGEPSTKPGFPSNLEQTAQDTNIKSVKEYSQRTMTRCSLTFTEDKTRENEFELQHGGFQLALR